MMKKKNAFTLIELLVVISIISVLMAVLMPALGRVKKQAQTIACRANLKSWGLCFTLYTDDNEGRFNSGWDIGETALWMNVLKPYYKDDTKMMRCPTAKTVVNSPSDWGTFKSWSREIMTPDGSLHEFVGSYSINSWTNNMTKDRGDRPKAWFWKTTHGMSGERDNIPVFADSTWHDGWPLDTDNPPATMDEFGTGNQGTTNEMKHFCIDRHNGLINSVFMDWSVRGVGLKELWTLKWHREFNTKGAWTKVGGIRPDDWPMWMSHYRDY